MYKNDAQIIKDIRSGKKARDKALAFLYQSHELKKRILSLLYHFGANEEKYEEVLIESLIIFDRNVRNGKFSESSSIITYIYSIAKYYWLTARRKKKIDTEEISLLKSEPIEIQNPELICIHSDLEELILEILGQIGERCRKVLRYWSLSYSYKEIAKELDMLNEQNARKRKYDCLKRMNQYIQSSPSHQHLLKIFQFQ